MFFKREKPKKGLVILEKEAGLARLTLNRPEALNSLNEEMVKELDAAVEEAIRDSFIGAAIIMGTGRAFCAGVDLLVMASFDIGRIMEFVEFGKRILGKIEHSDKPFVAAINGLAIGGGNELAVACHGRVASDDLRLGQPELRLGMIPFWGSTQRLPRLVGPEATRKLVINCDIITAKEAYGIGLVDKVVQAKELAKEAANMANNLKSSGLEDIKQRKFASRVETEFWKAFESKDESDKAPVALREALSVINKSSETDLDSGLLYETKAARRCFSTQDYQEAIKAFIEKRRPKFVGA